MKVKQKRETTIESKLESESKRKSKHGNEGKRNDFRPALPCVPFPQDKMSELMIERGSVKDLGSSCRILVSRIVSPREFLVGPR